MLTAAVRLLHQACCESRTGACAPAQSHHQSLNAAALQLWERSWAEMIGMPSRLTAEPQERASRAQMLATALQQHACEGYSGVRISKSGRRFQIHNARLWTLWGPGDQPCGQAAAFSDWWWL